MKIDYVLIFALLCIIAFATYFLFFVNQDGIKCYKDPIQFGIDKIKETSGTDVMCTCSAQGKSIEIWSGSK